MVSGTGNGAVGSNSVGAPGGPAIAAPVPAAAAAQRAYQMALAAAMASSSAGGTGVYREGHHVHIRWCVVSVSAALWVAACANVCVGGGISRNCKPLYPVTWHWHTYQIKRFLTRRAGPQWQREQCGWCGRLQDGCGRCGRPWVRRQQRCRVCQGWRRFRAYAGLGTSRGMGAGTCAGGALSKCACWVVCRGAWVRPDAWVQLMRAVPWSCVSGCMGATDVSGAGSLGRVCSFVLRQMLVVLAFCYMRVWQSVVCVLRCMGVADAVQHVFFQCMSFGRCIFAP